MRNDRVQIKPAMCLRAMQKDGDGGNGDMRGTEQDEHIAPPWQIDNALRGRRNEIDQVNFSLKS